MLLPRFTDFSIRAKIILFCTVVAFVSSSGMAVLQFSNARDNASELVENILSAEAQVVSAHIAHDLNEMSEDVKILSDTPSIQGLIAAQTGAEADDTKKIVWKNQLSVIFKSLMNARPHYTQIRFIRFADDGKELVRVNRTRIGLVRTAENNLQHKGKEPYVQEALLSRSGAVSFSEISLNREHSQVDPSETPTIRAFIQVADKNGDPFGMVVINADYAKMLSRTFKAFKPNFDVFLIEENSVVSWSHDDESVQFEFLDQTADAALTGLNASSIPDLKLQLADALYVKTKLDSAEDRKVGLPDLEVYVTEPRKDALAGESQAALWNALLGVVFVIVSAMLAAGFALWVTSPINIVKLWLRGERGSTTDLLEPASRNDEVGEFARILADLLDQLSVSQERLTGIIENIAEGLVVVDEEGRIETVNAAFEQMVGFEEQELVGQNFGKLIPGYLAHDPRNVVSFLEGASRHIRRGNTAEVEICKSDRTRLMADLSVTQFSGSDMRRFCIIIRDVTEIIRQKHEILAQKERLEQAEKVATLGHWSYDLTERSMVWSKGMFEIHGLSSYAMHPNFERAMAFHPSKDRQIAETAIENAIENGGDFDFVLRIVRPPGELRYVHSKGRVLKKQNNQMIFAVTQDVTEKRLAKAQLEESEQKNRNILDNIVDGVITVDMQGIIDGCNPACEDIFGFSLSELQGMDITKLMPQRIRSWHREFFSGEVKYDKSRVMGRIVEVEGIRKSGESFPLEIAISESTNGDQTLYTAILRDITQKKRLQEIQIQNNFISTVNHELRTPLTSIHGALDLVKPIVSKGEDAKLKLLVDLAYDGCIHLNHLVNDILDQEKITAGKMEYYFEAKDFSELVADIVHKQEGLATRCNVTFACATDETTGLAVSVDPGRFNQALVNLLSNAAKFSPEGSTINIATSIHGDGFVRVSVRDKGPGIEPGFRKKIFERFAQADSSTTKKFAGTGLGLNITKSIVDAFGGQISFDTELGKGTTFHITLPVHYEQQGVIEECLAS